MIKHLLIIITFLSIYHNTLFTQRLGTLADYILTNRIYWKADNIPSGTNSHITNVATNAGGEFVMATSDQSNGYPLIPAYFTNAILNWGNAIDTFILFIQSTNTFGSPNDPWQTWFENLSGDRITNIQIQPGDTNLFLFVIQPSTQAQAGSWVEYQVAAKSSNSARMNINPTNYIGDNLKTYGGPALTGLGESSLGPTYITITPLSTKQNDGFIRLQAATTYNYYVNDTDTTGDRFCNAVGDDANNGLTSSTPKRTITNLLSTYSLQPDTTVFVDTGIYNEQIIITSDDEGDSSGYVIFQGVAQGGTNSIINGTGAEDWDGCIEIRDADYICLDSLYVQQTTTNWLRGILCHSGSNLLIVNNIAISNKFSGIRVGNNKDDSTHESTVSNNICRLNNQHDTWEWASGILISAGHNNRIINNQCTKNGISSGNGNGIRIEEGAYNNIIENNNCCSNDRAGIEIRREGADLSSKGNQIQYNICNNNLEGISILSNNKFNTILDNSCNNNTQDGINVLTKANSNIIAYNGCTNNSQKGIDLYQNTGVSISNNNFINSTEVNIWIHQCDSATIHNNYCYRGAWSSSIFRDSDNIRFTDNTCNRSQSQSGLKFELNCNNLYIADNTFASNIGSGITVYEEWGAGQPHNITSSTLFNNDCNENQDSGIRLIKSTNCTVISNNLYDNDKHGLYIHTGQNNHIIGNQSQDAGTNGITVYNADNALIRNNKSYLNANGLFLSQSHSSTLINNLIYSNQIDGIKIQQCDNTFISNNHIGAGNNTGLSINTFSSNTLIKLNTICSNNNYGIWIGYSQETYIINNNIFYNTDNIGGYDCGINTMNNTKCRIYKNQIFNNQIGINFSDSDDNLISENIIYKNNSTGKGIIVTNNSINNYVINNTLYSNGVYGIYCDNTSSTYVKNTILAGHNNKGIHVSSGGTLDISYSCTNDGISGTVSDGTGCIDNDPLFYSTQQGNEDFRLSYNSPCIGTGSPESITTCMGAYPQYASLDNPVVSLKAQYTITFTTLHSNTSIPGNANLNINFLPAGQFNLNNTAFYTSTSVWGGNKGTISATGAGDTISVIRSGGNDTYPGQTDNLIFTNIINPSSGGENFKVIIDILDSGNNFIEQIDGNYFSIITNTGFSLIKVITQVSLGGTGENSIPGTTIDYCIQVSNTGVSPGFQTIVYDKISSYTKFKTNSAETANNWIIEYSTNLTPDHSFSSSDFTNKEPASAYIRWIRWKKQYTSIAEPIKFYYSVIIR